MNKKCIIKNLKTLLLDKPLYLIDEYFNLYTQDEDWECAYHVLKWNLYYNCQFYKTVFIMHVFMVKCNGNLLNYVPYIEFTVWKLSIL